MIVGLVGCTEVNRVSSNIGKEADNFNITRRIVVYNVRTDKLVFELIGNFSLQNSTQWIRNYMWNWQQCI